jgi:hypothetical protein
VRQGLAEAKERQFAKTPPNLDDDSGLAPEGDE